MVFNHGDITENNSFFYADVCCVVLNYAEMVTSFENINKHLNLIQRNL
jgi:hypothetical protein